MTSPLLPSRHAAQKWMELHSSVDKMRAAKLFSNTISKMAKINVTSLFRIKNMLLRDNCKPTDFYYRGDYVFCVRDNTVITLYKELPTDKTYFTYRYGDDAEKFSHLFQNKIDNS